MKEGDGKMTTVVNPSALEKVMNKINQVKVGPRHQHATSDVNDLPVGAIIPTRWVDPIVFDAAANVWLRCNGQSFNPTDYPDLVGLVPGNTVPNLTALQGMPFYIKATDFRVAPRHPIGWLKILSSIEETIFAHEGEWLRCDGREVSLEEYPDLVGLGGVMPPVTVFWDAIGQMTSNNTPPPIEVSSSSRFSAVYDAFRAFGRSERPQTHDAWLTAPNTFDLATGNPVNGTGEWLEIRLPEPILITGLAFRSRTTPITAGESSVRDFQLTGSNDRLNWTNVRGARNIPMAVVPYQLFEYIAFPEQAFKYWRFAITGITVGAQSRAHVGISELYLYETRDLPARVRLPNIPLQQGRFTYINARRARHVEE